MGNENLSLSLEDSNKWQSTSSESNRTKTIHLQFVVTSHGVSNQLPFVALLFGENREVMERFFGFLLIC